MTLENLLRDNVSNKKRLIELEAQERGLGDVASAFLMLPGLRGFWPMSAFDASGNALDQSANVRTLSYNGNPKYGSTGLAPYLNLDGVGDYLSRSDEAGLDITGTESNVEDPGLTMGCWLNTSAAGTKVILSKFSTSAGNFSYECGHDATAGWFFQVSSDGTALSQLFSISDIGRWRFLVCRFTPSSEMKIFLDNETAVATTSIPASIFSGSAAFGIGSRGAATLLLTGQVSLAFLCAAALSDAQISNLFEQSRMLYGV